MRIPARRDVPEPTGVSSAPWFVPAEEGATVAGYRVIRRLGASERADVYLGMAAGPPPDDTGPAVTGSGVPGSRAPVALKIFRLETAGTVIEREFRVLTETSGGRFVTLAGVATLTDGRVCFVQEHLSGIRLSRMLADGRLLTPGEAVTILAPVTAALAELLAMGYLHEGLGQRAVIFDATGRPVLTGLGRLRPAPPPGPGRRSVADEAVRRVMAFAVGVLDRVEPTGSDPSAPSPAAWLGAVSLGPSLGSVLDEFEHRLFAWAPATAVSLGLLWPDSQPAQEERWAVKAALREMLTAVGTAGLEDTAGRVGAVAAGKPARSEGLPLGGEAAGRGVGRAGRSPAALRHRIGRRVRLLLDPRLPVRLRERLAARFRAHRGRLLVSALLAAALAVLLLTLLYRPGARVADTPAPGSGLGAAQSTGSPNPLPSSQVPVSQVPVSPIPVSAPRDPVADRAAVEGDEPIQAVQVLLRLRDECVRSASLDCLGDVDQAGSAALASDEQAARAAQQGDQIDPAGTARLAAPTLVERRGDVALVAMVLTDASAGGNGKPASVLVVKGEAGWRIRQIFDY